MLPVRRTIVKKCAVVYVLIICFLFTGLYGEVQGPDRDKLPFWAKNAGTAAQRFELAKRSTPELIAFLKPMPKGADLHNHVGGAIYSEYILDRAEKKGLLYDIKARTFRQASRNSEDTVESTALISIAELIRNPQYYIEFLNAVSLRGYFPAIVNGHDHFFSAFNHIGLGRGGTNEIIPEVYRRNRHQNVQYMELMARFIPYDVTTRFAEAIEGYDGKSRIEKYKRIKHLFNDKNIRSSIRQHLDQWDRQLMKKLKVDSPITGNQGPLVIRYIVQTYRVDKGIDYFAEAAAAMAAINADKRLVALNIVAPEDLPASRLFFDDQMETLDFLWQKMGKPNITLHAGELVLRESPMEVMRNRIRKTVLKGHARRIGHGVSIAWEDNVVELLTHMSREGIAVEICLSSNEAILGVKGNDHPFQLYRRAGVPLTLNTDDEGILRTNLTMEFVKAVQRYDLSYDDLLELIRNSLEYSFLPGKSLYIERDYNRLHPGFEGIRSSNWKPSKTAESLMNKHPKLNRQVLLERELVKFAETLKQAE
jgi:adenosine deaminase